MTNTNKQKIKIEVSEGEYNIMLIALWALTSGNKKDVTKKEQNKIATLYRSLTDQHDFIEGIV